MENHRQHLRRGFNWLGGATLIAKIIDSGTILAVLLFLTKQQVGVASIVVSIGMVVEALDGFGTSEALVQARRVARLQLDTAFWFILVTALAVAGLILLAAPLIETAYGIAGMGVYFWAVALKQPIVGWALIPLALMNRDLQYERIAVVNVSATLAAALTRLGLAVSGAGAWALVAGHAASGLYILIGAQLARPFWPRLRFRRAAIVRLARFGLSAATANTLEQTFKNVDYLLIGWFFGPSPLAIYRVAFDVAMEPAMAVGTLVNRTALPVFARVAAVPARLAQAFAWSLQRLAALVAPLMVAIILAADPLMASIHDGQGRSYAAAAVPLKLLAAAALLRVTSQLLYPLIMGSGRPGMAARLSAATLALLTVGILVAGVSFPPQTGIVAVSAVWLGVYPLLLAWGVFYLGRQWGIRPADLARAFIAPAIAIGALVAIVLASRPLLGSDPRLQIGLVVATTALTYAALFRHGRERPVP